jgi:TRAP-type transport system periplasmic protein
MKKQLAWVSAAVVAIGLAASASAQEVTYRAVSFIPKNNPILVPANGWVVDVNTAMKGKFQINWVGGSEVIPRPQLFEAVRTGVVDMAIIVTADYQDQMPSAPAYWLSKLDPAAERKSGFFDYMTEEHKKLGVAVLGRLQMSPFYLWTKKEPKKLDDLKGLKMRTASLYDRFMRELGMTPVNINAPETYTALEGGVVDGLGWPPQGVKSQGWSKQVRYAIDLPFFEYSNTVALMNWAKWTALPEATRKQLMELTAAFEPKMVKTFRDQIDAEWKELEKDGVKRVKFSDAENKKYQDTAYEVEWKALAAKLPPETITKLRKLTGN